jgi:hypothetical protein
MRMNKTVRLNVQRAFQGFLDAGHFPEVGWNRGNCLEYDTFQYLNNWGRMVYLVNENLKRRGYLLGCYELRRSDGFRQDVIAAIRSVTPAMIAACDRTLGVPN